MQQPERAALLDAALSLAGSRHPVVPLHTPTDRGGEKFGTENRGKDAARVGGSASAPAGQR